MALILHVGHYFSFTKMLEVNPRHVAQPKCSLPYIGGKWKDFGVFVCLYYETECFISINYTKYQI